MAAGVVPTDSDSQPELPLTQKDLDAVRTELVESAAADKLALSTQLASTQERLRAAEELAKAAVAQPAKSAPKVYDRHELETMVESGQISAGTRDDIWQQQQAASQKVEIEERIQAGIAQYRVEDTNERELALYREHNPEVFKDGTPERAKVQEAYDHLIKLGDSSDDPRTQMKALYAALGPATARIQERTASRTPTHVESGGSGSGSSSGSPDSSDGAPKAIRDNPRLKSHYDMRIRQGEYTGYDDPKFKSEMKYVQKRSDRLAAE